MLYKLFSRTFSFDRFDLIENNCNVMVFAGFWNFQEIVVLPVLQHEFWQFIFPGSMVKMPVAEVRHAPT